MRKCLSQLPDKWKLIFSIMLGIAVGLALYTVYISRAHSYLSDNPTTCINCHVMTPAYQSWSRSSHMQWASCNDCHVPQDSVFKQYFFKAKDGLRHAAVFTLGTEPQAPRPTPESSEVIMDNCIRCHTQLNTALVKTGSVTFEDVQHGNGRLCWDCHRQTPHTNISSLSSAPNAIVPTPTRETATVPKWLKEAMKK